MKAVTKEERRAAYPLVLIFVLLAAGIVTAGHRYYRNYERQFRAEAGRQLSAVAELKVDELVQYRKERLWDADTLFKNTAFSGLARRFFEHPEDAEAQQQIQEWAAKYLATEQYDLVCLFDAQGVVRLSVPAESPISSFVSQRVPEVLRSGQVTFLDFHRNEQDQQIYLTLLVPILDESDANRPLGAFALRIDPETYLYPFLQRWPTPSLPAETLLIRRDGNDALCLNELKFRTNTALHLRYSLEHTNSAAVKAVLGQKGVVEARDALGAPVLAALYAIPDSPWFLVTRMDTAKVYAPLRERMRLTILLVSLLLISAGLGIGAIWWHQRVRFYRVKYEAEADRANLSAIVESSEDAIISKSLDGTITSWNAGAERLFGYRAEEMIGQPIARIIPPSSQTWEAEILARVRRGESVEHYETVRIAKDGRPVDVSLTISPIRNAAGAIIGASKIARDITERKRAEEELRNSRALYYSLVENLPQSVFRKDRAGRFQFVNERFCQGLRRSSKDIVGRTDADFFPPELAQAYRKDDLRVMETGQVLDREENHMGADGRELIVHVIKTPLRDATGKVIGIQGVFWDVTERKRAEESLHYEQTLMATLMENLPDAVYFKDAASRFLRVNRAMSRKFGLSDPAQLVGKSDTDLFSGEHSRQALADEQEIIRTGQPLLNVEEKETWLDGTVSWVLTTKLPLRDAAGRIIGTCGISRDITERKRTEEALQESRALYYSLVEQLPVGVFRKDREGRYVLVNPEFCRLKGMKAEEFLGKKPQEVAAVEVAKQGALGLATKYAAAGVEHHEQIMQTGKPIELVEEYEHADGRKQFLHVMKLPVFGPGGKIIGSQGIQIDITERKLAEETIAHERQLLRTLIDLLPETFYIKDLDSRFLVANEALAKQWGKANPSQLLGLSDADLFPAELAATYRAEDQKVFAGEPLIGREGVCVFADGREHTVLTTKVPYRDIQGRIYGLVGFGYDITERKRVEAALQEAGERFQLVTRATKDAVWDWNLTDPAWWNDTFYEIYGFDRNSPPSLEAWASHIHPDDQERVMAGFRAVVEHGEAAWSDEFRFRRADGTYGHVFDRAYSLRNASRKTVRMIGSMIDITERKRAEMALKESEVRYQRITEAITDYIYTVRVADGRAAETTHGPGCLAVTGYRSNEFANDPFLWLRMVVAEDRPGVEEQARRILAGDNPPSVEHRIVHKNGSLRWVRNTFVPHRDERGALVSYDGLIQDITARKRAEDALRESEERYRTIMEQAGDAIFMHDQTGRILDVNQKACQSLGYSRGELLSKSIKDIDPEAIQTGKHELWEKILGGEQFTFESRQVRKDGSFIPVEVTLGSVRLPPGPVVLGIARDITERKRAEEALRESETELRAILESTADGILAVDNKGKVIKANQRFVEFGGFPQSLMDVGEDRVLLDFVLKQLPDPDAFLKRVQSLYGTDTVAVDTLVFKDGRVFERHSFPMLMDGAVIGRVWSFRDITERKRQERELVEKSAELERFTYTVSHDLKSPLVTVKTFLGYLEQDLLNPDAERVKQDVGYMRTAADKMGHLLDELLNLARVGRKMNPPVRVTFQQLAREAVGLVAGRISTSGVEVQVADATVVLEGDRSRLVEIWQNLVENACKFMGDQLKPRVEIGVEKRGAETVFFVRDNGAGIEPRFQEKVFSLFEKLNPKIEGTGMGLALVKRVVELYKGRIWVESGGLGQGANFLFTLPAAVIIEKEQSS
jgi:PAS domain S-box-containing protein